MTRRNIEKLYRLHESSDQTSLATELHKKFDIGLWIIAVAITSAFCVSVWLAFHIWGVR